MADETLRSRAKANNINIQAMINEISKERYFALIDKLNLAEVVALFGKHDPLRLYQYIKIYYPELSEDTIQGIITHARGMLKGIRSYDSGDMGPSIDEIHYSYKTALDIPILDSLPEATNENYFVLSGKVEDDDITRLRLKGSCSRTIIVKKDRTFSVVIPLANTGDTHSFELYAYNDRKKFKSGYLSFDVEQTGEKIDTEDIFRKLLVFKEDILDKIKQSPEHYQYLLECIELSLLKMFTYSEAQGIKNLRNMIEQEQSNEKKRVYELILDKFLKIKSMKVDNIKPEQRLYFFQKYIIYRIQELKEAGMPGVILAAEQGLGKTLMALVLMNGLPALVLAPGPVVTTWTDIEGDFFLTKNLDTLEGSYRERDKSLARSDSMQIVTNKEFVRRMPDARREALEKFTDTGKGMLIVDEADYLNSPNSQESEGTRKLKAAFKMLLTATPFKRPAQIVKLLQFLYPDDPKFQSQKAFAQAFGGDKESFDALYLALKKHTIRVRKQDVFKTYDKNIPLDEQTDCLPERVEIFPGTESISPKQDARFYLSKEQCDSILELFTDYYKWCRNHESSGKITDEDKANLKKQKKENRFSKMHALRQIMNDPAYIGRPDIESPKHLKMDSIVEYELNKASERKVLIFCQYKDQVREYQKRYAKYGTRVFYGDLESNSNGYKIDKQGKALYYVWDKMNKRFAIDDTTGYPVLADTAKEAFKGDNFESRPIRALDYEKIVFQNSPTDRVMVATFSQGAVGVTLTAADAVIFDDLAQTYRDEYQAAERAHRIDNMRKKYDVTYYWLQGLYPEAFLESVKGKAFTYEKHGIDDDGDITVTDVVVDMHDFFFKEGTYDQVLFDVLRNQGAVFHEIMDGIGDFSELDSIKDKIFSTKMPYILWSNSEDTRGSSAGTLPVNLRKEYLDEQQLLTAA
jgi:superfamily II DNA or RNA helicase